MPLNASGQDDVQVGRIRQSLVFGDHGLEFFVAGDQLLRGAALNAVLIAEQAVKKNTMPVPWGMHKFGGASLADDELYRTCGNILIAESKRGGASIPTAAVVSAMKGMTDKLVAVVETATKVGGEAAATEKLNEVVNDHVKTAQKLLEGHPALVDGIIKNIMADSADISALLRASSLLRVVPNSTMELVAGMGEIWSAQLLSGYLKTQGIATAWLNARDVLIVEGKDSGLGAKGAALDMGVQPLYDETAQRLEAWLQKHNDLLVGDTPPILIVTGFVATTADGVPTTLKRSGSDYSATIFARLLKASHVTLWKNVDGVFRADPGSVPNPASVKSMSYNEAIELAYFGGQVLHPSAMLPAVADNTPVYVRNVFNPAFAGTEITSKGDPDAAVQVITSIPKIAMVDIDGGSWASVSRVTQRVMKAMEDAGIKVVLVTQACASHSISVAVDEAEGKRAVKAVEQAFELELARSEIGGVKATEGYAILSIVGDEMKGFVGTLAKLTAAIARSGTNIISIAQGSSERSITVVVEKKKLAPAMKAVHDEFVGKQFSLTSSVEDMLFRSNANIKRGIEKH
jgi:aspartokinase/homoserine dehydrogenase 1